MNEAQNSKFIKAARRELEMIRVMAGNKLSAGEISRRSGYPPETVRRTLASFERYGSARSERIGYMDTVLWWLEDSPDRDADTPHWRDCIDTAKRHAWNWKPKRINPAPVMV